MIKIIEPKVFAFCLTRSVIALWPGLWAPFVFDDGLGNVENPAVVKKNPVAMLFLSPPDSTCYGGFNSERIRWAFSHGFTRMRAKKGEKCVPWTAAALLPLWSQQPAAEEPLVETANWNLRRRFHRRLWNGKRQQGYRSPKGNHQTKCAASWVLLSLNAFTKDSTRTVEVQLKTPQNETKKSLPKLGRLFTVCWQSTHHAIDYAIASEF